MKPPLSQAEFHDLVSGTKTGFGATVLRTALRILELPYTAIVTLRNWSYDNKVSKSQRAKVPVISIGNLTMGGTGKTPMVVWLVRWLENRGITPAIVSRGYGAENGQPNDEARELEQLLPDTPHFQNPDRVTAAQDAVDQYDVDAIVLDDGFQHRRLHRDLDIVLIDALQPYGFSHVFPRGSLREPLQGIARAHFAILTRSACIPAEQRAEIKQTYQRLAPNLGWTEASHRATGLVSTLGDHQPVELLANRRVFSFCGIGNPAGFTQTLAEVGCHPVETRQFKDHYEYRVADLQHLEQSAKNTGAELLVCTQKDLVKIERLGRIQLPVYALQIEMIVPDCEALEAAILAKIDSAS